MNKKDKKNLKKAKKQTKEELSQIYKKFTKQFKKYKYKKQPKLNSKCKTESFKLHSTQKFLKDYFKPEKNKKGMVLYHSVGSGKTCAAIAMASNFEDHEYSILWVTRNSLVKVMYQNLWGDQTCHPKMIANAKRITDSSQKVRTFNSITKNAWMKPVSYRSFSNITKGKSRLYKKLVQKNGEKDPLRKTLIIIDEAHNFTTLKPIGFTKRESAKFQDIRDMIYRSYQKSGKDSARIIMLSATPGLNGAVGAINMLNLLEPKKENRLPIQPKEFISTFMKKDMSGFNQEGRTKFGKQANKYVSFLDTTRDYTKFARKVFETYNDPISKDRSRLKQRLLEVNKEKVQDHCKRSTLMKQIMDIIKQKGIDAPLKIAAIDNILQHTKLDTNAYKAIFLNTRKLFADCRKRYENKKEQDKCINFIKGNKKEAMDRLRREVKEEAEKCKVDFKNKKGEAKQKILDKIKKKHLLIEKNQQDALEKCMSNEVPAAQRAKCLRSVLLWNDKTDARSKVGKKYIFDNKNYDPDVVKSVLPVVSAKFAKLVKTIKDLDKKDKCAHKKTFKHVIFIDDYRYVKLLLSVLMASDFKLALQQTERKKMRKGKMTTFRGLDTSIPKRIPRRTHLSKNTPIPKHHEKNVTLLTKASIFKRTIGKNLATKIKAQFNKRPDNVYGKDVRFLILDSNFLEGVSLFDVKYLHILTPPKTQFQKEQLIGRVVRRCGHKGLPMEKGQGGWNLNVLVYKNRDAKNIIIDQVINELELQKELKGEEERLDDLQLVLVNEMEKNALDRKLISDVGKSYEELFKSITLE